MYSTNNMKEDDNLFAISYPDRRWVCLSDWGKIEEKGEKSGNC